VVVIDLTDAGVAGGCVQTAFPDEQPDLSLASRPTFLLTTPAAQQSTAGQATVQPGEPVEAEIGVNGATRQALVELQDAWNDLPAIGTQQIDTPGNRTLELLFPTDLNVRPSRYYMRITLCGVDCNERQVVFDINPDINSDYERTLIEDGEVVQVDRTCVDFQPRPGIGSGTVVIQ
jgi:hypothetical protein